jgi:hypothetical protein
VIRPRICLECRTLLEKGEVCDGGGKHRPVSPRTPSGREALLRSVWGPPGARERTRELVKVGGSGAGAAAILEGACQGCTADVSIAIVVAAFALVAAGSWWLGTFVWRNVQEYRNRLKPRGAARPPPRLRGEPLTGVARAVGPKLEAAASGTACLAYGVELHSDRHAVSPVMLRHAESTAFVIELDDGSRVEVPAGRVRLEGTRMRVDAADHQLGKRIGLDLRIAEKDMRVVPHDAVHETVLRDGDRVAIYGDLESEAVEDPTAHAYREAPKRRYVPAGVPRLRLAT